MKNWFKDRFGKAERLPEVKWRTDSSIHNLLVNSLDAEGYLKIEGRTLPDEKGGDANEIQFAPGLMDAMFGADDSEDSVSRIHRLIELLVEVSRTGK